MDTLKAKKIELKLYLEGIEFPVNQVSINESIGTYPTCTLIVPATASILDLEPRTLTHVFYKDSTFYKDSWVLIFEGEVATVTHVQATGHHSVNLHCVSLASHWESAIKSGSGLDTLLRVNGQATARVKASYVNTGKDDVVPDEVKDVRDIIKEGEDKDIAAMVSGLNSEFSNLASTLHNIIKSEETFTDDKFSKFFGAVTSLFGVINYGYSVFHVVYKIMERFTAFENSKITAMLESEMGKSLLNKSFENFSSELSLLGALFLILKLINYNLIIPAAPTYDEEAGAPQSFVCIPNAYSFLPVASNVFFKDQVENTTYQKPLISAPTRMYSLPYAAYNLLTSFGGNPDLEAIFSRLLVAPSNKLKYTKRGENVAVQLALTTNERMSGIRATRASVENYDSLTVELNAKLDRKVREVEESNLSEEDKKEKIDALAAEYDVDKKKIDDLLEEYSLNSLNAVFDTAVLGSRTFNLKTSYSPHRICGLPGVYINDDGPCIVGLVSEISSTFGAEGFSSSSVNFVYPRNIITYDDVALYTSEATTLEEYLVLDGWNKKDVRDVDKLKKAWPFLPDFEYDFKDGKKSLGREYVGNKDQKIAWINHIKLKLSIKDEINFLLGWLDEKRYFPDKLGTGIYKKLMYGVGVEDKEFSDTNKNKFFKGASKELDGGIGKYKTSSVMFGERKKDSWENTNWFVYYVSEMKKMYLANMSGKKQFEFINKIIKRNIITEEDYWKFFVGNQEPRDATRSVTSSASGEIKDIKKARDGKKNLPFIKERQEMVNKIKKQLLVVNYDD